MKAGGCRMQKAKPLGLTECEPTLTQENQQKYLDDELSLERSLPVGYGRVERSYILLIY